MTLMSDRIQNYQIENAHLHSVHSRIQQLDLVEMIKQFKKQNKTKQKKRDDVTKSKTTRSTWIKN